MANIGVLIESGTGGIKETNFGVITAARRRAGDTLFAFLLNGDAAAAKDALQAYGVQKIIGVSAAAPDFGERPELQSAALQAALQHFEISVPSSA